MILCDEWSEAQVKVSRLVVNRSVAWADWDDELLALELQELNAADFDLGLTGFDPKELEDLLATGSPVLLRKMERPIWELPATYVPVMPSASRVWPRT